MRTRYLVAALMAMAAPLSAQPRVDLLYGVHRNVASPEAEYDGWLSMVVAWPVRGGLELGVGTDHFFESPGAGPREHEGWALVASVGRAFGAGRVRPFLRGGLGAGPAPCEGDTCGDGIYVRGSAGARVRLAGALRLTMEVGLSRISRPLAGVGLSLRPGG